MTNRLLPFCIVVALFLASCAGREQVPAKGFEGTITESIQIPGVMDMMHNATGASDTATSDTDGTERGMQMLGAAANMTLKMYVRENKVAYDVSLLGGLISARSIIDRNTRTMTMLMPGHTAMVMNLRDMDSAREVIDDSLEKHSSIFDSLAAVLPQPTGQKQTLHGLEAEEYKGGSNGNEVDLWLSSNDKIKAFEIIRDAFLGRGAMGQGGLDQVFGMMRPVAGKIPVKFETKVHGKTFAKGELTEITEEKLDDAIFEVPKDYQIINADTMRHFGYPKKQRHFTAP